MPETTRGAIDGNDAFAFFIENNPWFYWDTNSTSDEWIPFGEDTINETITRRWLRWRIKATARTKRDFAVPGCFYTGVQPDYH